MPMTLWKPSDGSMPRWRRSSPTNLGRTRMDDEKRVRSHEGRSAAIPGSLKTAFRSGGVRSEISSGCGRDRFDDIGVRGELEISGAGFGAGLFVEWTLTPIT